jgi:hypothetical protein
MSAIRMLVVCGCIAAFTWTSPPAAAQSGEGNTGIRKQLEALYPVTKTTADGTDIVTAGAVLVLQKDNLQMCKVNLPIPTHNWYKNGEVTQGALLGMLNRLGNASLSGDTSTTRKFVAGEKFWVTKIDAESDGVSFDLLSDPYQDVRYHATLKFPYQKGQTPAPDQVAGLVAQVIKADGAQEADANQGQGGQGQADTAAPETKTIALGQTKDQVAQSFGAPTKIVQLGAKEIDYYPDMKVTFMKNVVTNVE